MTYNNDYTVTLTSPYDVDANVILGWEHEFPYLDTDSIFGLNDDVLTISSYDTLGRKFDKDKLQYGLIPPHALKATVEILTFGAEKYEPNNWIHVPDSKRRYFDAAQRHLWAWKEGEQNDPESGKNHLAHALCCLMFLYEHDTIYSVDNERGIK